MGAFAPLVWGVLFPIVASTLISGFAWKLWSWGPREGTGPRWAAPLALAAGLIVGIWGVFGRPPLPPHAAHDWVILVAAGALVWALVEAFVTLPIPALVAGRFVVLGGTAGAILSPVFTNDGVGVGLLAAGIATVLGLAAWLAGEHQAERTPGWTWPLLLTGVATGAAVALLLGGSIRLAQIAGMVAAGCGPWLVAGVIRPSLSIGRGFLALLVPVLTALVLCGRFFNDLPTGSAVALPFGLVLPLAVEFLLPAAWKERFWVALAVRGAAVALPVLVAGAFALAYQPEPTGYY